MWNIGLDSQGAFCVCVVSRLPMAPFSGVLLLCVKLFLYAWHALNFYYISITLYVCVCVFLYSPKLAPLLYWDPCGETMAQREAFTPICHRLSPFVRPDKQNVGPRSPPVWPQHTWDQLFSWLFFSRIPFVFFTKSFCSSFKPGQACAQNSFPRLITSFHLTLIL